MEAIVIMMLVLFEVALWQWRVAITGRGNALGGAVLGLLGAIVQITAITRVVQDMSDVMNIAGYATGVAIGVFVGCMLDRRVHAATMLVRVFAPADPALVPALRGDGWPVTATNGDGHGGPVDVLYVVVDQRRVPSLEHEVQRLAPEACWTVERVATSRGLLPVVTGSSASRQMSPARQRQRERQIA
jgi:uncharacterized protein YebE (UPF0316 family)